MLVENSKSPSLFGSTKDIPSLALEPEHASDDPSIDSSKVDTAANSVPYPKPAPETSGSEAPKNKTEGHQMPEIDRSPLNKFKAYGAELKEALEDTPIKSDQDKVSKIGHALFLYKNQFNSLLDEYRLFMATEFMEAASFEGSLRGATILDTSETFGYGELIPIIHEAKRWVREISLPWHPPKEFWVEMLAAELETVSTQIWSWCPSRGRYR